MRDLNVGGPSPHLDFDKIPQCYFGEIDSIFQGMLTHGVFYTISKKYMSLLEGRIIEIHSLNLYLCDITFCAMP